MYSGKRLSVGVVVKFIARIMQRIKKQVKPITIWSVGVVKCPPTMIVNVLIVILGEQI